jgi:hypothetical protein
MPRCITHLAPVSSPELGFRSGHIACTFCGPEEQAYLIKGLNLMLRMFFLCFLHLGIMPRCITDLLSMSSPEVGFRSGHIACTFCGPEEQAYLIKGLNLMLRMFFLCFLHLGIMPRCITDLTVVYPPELEIRSGHIACRLCGTVEQAHLMKGLKLMVCVTCRCFLRLRIIPRCIAHLAAVSSLEFRIRSGYIACLFCGAVEQAHLITGLNLLLRMFFLCFLHLGIMPRCITDLLSMLPPELRTRSGHFACAFCGAVEQAHLMTCRHVVRLM